MKYYPENEEYKAYVINTPRLADSAANIDTLNSLDKVQTLLIAEIAFQLKRIADTLVNFGINGVPVEKVP
jgi:hypothetical protein